MSIAIAAALCGANAVLWAVVIHAGRATDRDAAYRARPIDRAAAAKAAQRWEELREEARRRRQWADAQRAGVARGGEGMGGRAEH